MLCSGKASGIGVLHPEKRGCRQSLWSRILQVLLLLNEHDDRRIQAPERTLSVYA